MKTEFLRRFYKDLDKIKSPSTCSNIVDAIENVESANLISDIKGIKKLVGFKNAYRIRIGDYRIGLFIEDKTAQFARIVHRKDIYNLFP
jgi:mRNA interferase RelE/StbE